MTDAEKAAIEKETLDKVNASYSYVCPTKSESHDVRETDAPPEFLGKHHTCFVLAACINDSVGHTKRFVARLLSETMIRELSAAPNTTHSIVWRTHPHLVFYEDEPSTLKIRCRMYCDAPLSSILEHPEGSSLNNVLYIGDSLGEGKCHI